jgi:hypothetical protein
MPWKYKAKNGETITVNDPNTRSVMKRDGFEFVGEVDQKGKLIKKDEGEEGTEQ